MKRVRIIVSGRVQKVGYRYYIKTVGSRLGLDGWVKNSTDGKVEIIAEGQERLINEFLEYCRRGPPLADVEDIDVEPDMSSDKLRGFEIVL